MTATELKTALDALSIPSREWTTPGSSFVRVEATLSGGRTLGTLYMNDAPLWHAAQARRTLYQAVQATLAQTA
jgi:hypothetical protein